MKHKPSVNFSRRMRRPVRRAISFALFLVVLYTVWFLSHRHSTDGALYSTTSTSTPGGVVYHGGDKPPAAELPTANSLKDTGNRPVGDGKPNDKAVPNSQGRTGGDNPVKPDSNAAKDSGKASSSKDSRPSAGAPKVGAGAGSEPGAVGAKPGSNAGSNAGANAGSNAGAKAGSNVGSGLKDTANVKGEAYDKAAGATSKSGGESSAFSRGMREITRVLDQIAGYHPGVSKLTTYNRDIKSDTVLNTVGELPATSTVMSMYLQVSDEDVAKLKFTHQKVFDLLPRQVVPNAFTGKGVVMTGGGAYFPMVLTAIKWLRSINNNIPIEVFMADSAEYEPRFCDDLFPSLNVECRVIEDIYGAQLAAKLGSKYALKPLAILASKFDDIYFMDADSLPLYDVAPIFDSEVYKETGMVLNSDYWPRYISPRFYEIVGVNLGERARGDRECPVLLQSDRQNAVPGFSTESGQVFVNKSRHIRSLILAMYYNLFGPEVYFPLLMQNGHGEGDKDTYAAAATITGEEFYQTKRRPVTLGVHVDGTYYGYAMVQPDPVVDFRINELKSGEKERFFALHSNSLKANPKYMLQDYKENIRGHPPLQKARYFGNMDNIEKEVLVRDDIELRMFEVMQSVTCEWAAEKNYIPRDWEDQDVKRLCRILTSHIEWLRLNPDQRNFPHGDFLIDEESGSFTP